MATGQKKIYIAKDGEILYGEEREEYLRNESGEEDFADSSGLYIKGGYVLCGKAAKQERLADDVRDALKQSGMDKWLDKLENEAKEKKNKKPKHDVNNENEGSSTKDVTNPESPPSEVQDPASVTLGKIVEDACECEDEQINSIIENVCKIHETIPMSTIDKGLQVAKDVQKTGQEAIEAATEAGKVIKDIVTGNTAEVNVSGNAHFTGNLEGDAIQIQKMPNKITAGEAHLQLKGSLHSDAQLEFSNQENGRKIIVGGTFDAEFSADAELVGLDAQTGDHTKQEITQKPDVESTTKEEELKIKSRFEGQANASARGARVKINTPRPDIPHTKREVPDLEINATAQAQATGINVDINTANKPKSDNKTNDDPKLRLQGKASASATGVDVKVGNELTVGEECNAKTLEAHAHVETTGCEVQIGNKIKKPEFKGASASAKAKVSGATARLGNVYKLEHDKAAAATAEVRVAGAELNMGNVNLDKGSSSGVAAVKEVKTGLSAFNVQVGMGGKAGIQTSTDVKFGNIGFNLGPPSITISPPGLNFGFGSGIKSSTGTASKGGKGDSNTADGSSDGNVDSAGASYKRSGGSGGVGTNCSGSNMVNLNADCSSETNGSGYMTSSGSYCLLNDGDYNGNNYKMRGSGLQFSGSGNCTTTSSNSNAEYTQNSSDALHSRSSSHWERTTRAGKTNDDCSGSASGYNRGIKSSTGTASKGGKGDSNTADGSSDGNVDSAGASYKSSGGSGGGVGTNCSGSNMVNSDADCSSETNGSGYMTSSGSYCLLNDGDYSGNNYKMRGLGLQFGGIGNCTTTSSNSNAEYTQTSSDALHSRSSSHWEHTTRGGKTNDDCSGSASGCNHGLNDSCIGSDIQDTGHFNEHSSVTHLEDSPSSAPQFAYSSGSCDHKNMTSSTSHHIHNGHVGAKHTTNTYRNTSSSFSEGNSCSSGCGHAGNNASYDFRSTATCTAAGKHIHRKTKSVNISHPTLSTDNEIILGGEQIATFHNPHQLPRKLNEGIKSQTNVPSYKISSQSCRKSNLHQRKHSGTGNGLFGEATHPNAKNDTQKSIGLNDYKLAHQVKLILSISEESTKKAEKSKTPSRCQESKQILTERFIKVREKLEADASKPSTASISSTEADDATEESKESTSSSSKSKPKSDTTGTDQQDDVEEVPIEDKKKPFGTHNNIHTIDTIEVQTSNRSLKTIGHNVVGFK